MVAIEGKFLRPIPAKPALAAAFLLLPGLAPSGATGAAYYYFSDPVSTKNIQIALKPDPGWIAIHGNSDGLLDRVISLIKDSGLKSNGKPERHLPGWYLANFPDQGDQASLIEQLAEADNRDGIRDFYLAPVFIGRSGGRTIPGNSILLRWTEGRVPELREKLRPDSCDGDPEPTPMESLQSVYRIRPRCHSGLVLIDYANRLAESDETRFSEPDMIVGGLREPGGSGRLESKAPARAPGREKLTPADDDFSSSWHWENTGQEGGKPGMDVNIISAWDLTTGVGSVETAILDVGVEQDHSDISQKPGKDFTGQGSTGGGPNNSCDNHGTPVAGAVSAPINDQDTVGAAPATISRSARVFISEVDDPCSGRWTTQFSWTVNALDWAFNQGMRVTNNSNSYDQPSSTIASKYQETHDLGMVHFSSAGNNGRQGMNFPANLSSVNAVSAVNRYGQRAAFSNYGSGLSVAAPGVEIYLPDRQGTFGYVSGDVLVGNGTSYASPIAAGVAALLFSRAGNLDGGEVELFLQAAARDLGAAGKDDDFGWGLVDAYGTLLLLDIFADDLETGNADRWSRTVP